MINKIKKIKKYISSDILIEMFILSSKNYLLMNNIISYISDVFYTSHQNLLNQKNRIFDYRALSNQNSRRNKMVTSGLLLIGQ